MNLSELRRLPYAAFDFDGTLADSNGAYIDFSAACFREAGKQMPPDFVERAKAMSLTDFCAALEKELGVWDRAEVIRRLDEFSGDFYSSRVKLKPGAREYLTQLRSEGVRMCILSATAERYIRMAVPRLDLGGFFEFIMTPDQTGGRPKSLPDIFELTCRRFGDVPPGSVAMYDDSLEALRTAHAVGMATIGVYDDAGADTAEEIRALCGGYILDFHSLLYV